MFFILFFIFFMARCVVFSYRVFPRVFSCVGDFRFFHGVLAFVSGRAFSARPDSGGFGRTVVLPIVFIMSNFLENFFRSPRLSGGNEGGSTGMLLDLPVLTGPEGASFRGSGGFPRGYRLSPYFFRRRLFFTRGGKSYASS